MSISFSLLLIIFNSLFHFENGHHQEFTKCKFYYNASLRERIYTEVNQLAEFPGGVSEQQRFFNKHFRYPQQELENNLQTTVIIKFIVDTNGSTKNYSLNGKLENDNLTPLESETLKMLKQMPKWIPGKCNGKIVPVEVKMPFIVDVSRD